MKKLILFLLLIPALCFGDMNPYVAGIPADSSSTDILSTVTFETTQSFSDASSADVDIDPGEQGWVSSATNQYYITNDQKKNGTQSLKNDNGDSTNVQKIYTEQTGEHWVDFWCALGTATGDAGQIIIADGTATTSANQAILLSIDTQDIEYFDGSAWQSFCTDCITVNNQFYRIQLLLKPASNTFDGYLDGSSKASGGSFRNSSLTPDRIGLKGSASSVLLYIDDVQVYTGSRK